MANIGASCRITDLVGGKVDDGCAGAADEAFGQAGPFKR